MLLNSIVLDAEMSAVEVLERLAQHGLWLNDQLEPVRKRVEPIALLLQPQPYSEVAARLRRDVDLYGVAIRRQWGSRVLWYAFPASEVLRCSSAAAEIMLLVDAMSLQEAQSTPPIQTDELDEVYPSSRVVLDGAHAVGILHVKNAIFDHDVRSEPVRRGSLNDDLRGTGEPQGSADVRAWPRVDAPQYQRAGDAFEVVVGLGASRDAKVTGSQISLPRKPGQEVIEVTVELSSTEVLEAPQGWRRTMNVPVRDPASAEVRFTLIGTEPTNREKVSLTMLEVRYLVDATVCGIAARPLVIVPAASPAEPSRHTHGSDWRENHATSAQLALVGDPNPPDLTIEIMKPDANVATGNYVCRLYSPHALATPLGPFNMDLGSDAKSFARQLVDDIRMTASSPIVDNMLESNGRLVAERLPGAVFDAFREVAAVVAPEVPAVLIVSAEAYVPWELAWVEPVLDDSRPAYLGAQALVGRWLRDDAAPTRQQAGVSRPALHPSAQLSVRHIAVMAALYRAETGFRRLPKAEEEAKYLVDAYQGVGMESTAQDMRSLLGATLRDKSETIVSIDAVHLAGHGEFDVSRPDASVLFLADGTPLRSTVFRSAKYGGEHQPLMFLNACMLGIGGELLGDFAGFPGNSLRGGFGGVVGALWEVDDSVAHDIALEFWKRALCDAPGRGEPIGGILRDLRGHYVSDAAPAPISTYLSYVYYGHPRLTLQRTG